MSFILIKGTFHIVGYQPDGDSIRFHADNPEVWKWFTKQPVELNARQHAQLRIEGIDTLETHYENHHQPLKFARAATRSLLAGLGIKNVKLTKSGLGVKSAKDGTRGYLVSAKAEGHGRPVAFVFAGDSSEADGTEITLEPQRLDQSLNYQLARAGLAYPTYYSSLAPELRDKLTTAVVAARAAGAGLWPKDKTLTGANLSSLWWITSREIILPKLFRRTVVHLSAGGIIAGLPAFLAAHPDPVKDLTTGKWTRFDKLIALAGQRVRLTVAPENLVFREKA